MTTSATPDADYAFWTIPGTSFTVTYSLGTFHEIDYVVNEGYRRIPHGGVETGGLLFGQVEKDGVRVENFRLIECEHASGPSFNLSAKDLAALQAQISSSASDPELQGFQVVGWFIAHTRTPLKMSSTETQLFEQYFPGPGKLTVLVKPERFHPTRFGFLFRDKEGRVEADATAAAIILPGRGTQGREGPVPSILAPLEIPAARASERPRLDTFAKPAAPKTDTRPKTETAPGLGVPAHSVEPPARAVSLDVPSLEMEAVPAATSLPVSTAGLNSFSLERAAPGQYGEGWSAPTVQLPRGRQRPTTLDEDRKGYGAQFALVLLVAALLGCCVGYWAYLQLPAAIIPLSVHVQQDALLISWPSEQTRTSAYAAIRVDDAQPVALSSAEKEAGQTSIVSSGDDVKIEVLAQHWLRDSRGIVRFVKGQQPGSSAAPPAASSHQTPSSAPTALRLP